MTDSRIEPLTDSLQLRCSLSAGRRLYVSANELA